MAEIVLDIDYSDLKTKLARFSNEIDVAMSEALDAVAQKIVVHARLTTLFQDRTSALRKSIIATPAKGSFSGGSVTAQVTAGGGTLRYAKAIHDGSRRHTIRAKNVKALRIPTGGGFYYVKSVVHPGTKPRPFMSEAVDAIDKEAPRIVEAFTTRALRRSGLL